MYHRCTRQIHLGHFQLGRLMQLEETLILYESFWRRTIKKLLAKKLPSWLFVHYLKWLKVEERTWKLL
ncbi:Proline--tRNA ligase [Bienertia sinuspersici]